MKTFKSVTIVDRKTAEVLTFASGVAVKRFYRISQASANRVVGVYTRSVFHSTPFLGLSDKNWTVVWRKREHEYSDVREPASDPQD